MVLPALPNWFGCVAVLFHPLAKAFASKKLFFKNACAIYRSGASGVVANTNYHVSDTDTQALP
jgi:hypothetical protein